MEQPKKSLIVQTWRRCKLIGRSRKPSDPTPSSCPSVMPGRGTTKEGLSKGREGKRHRPSTPSGCFCVYVGPQKQRFFVRAESANHPLFRMLLEEAESEYGFTSGGPLELPCNVDLFYRVLSEMECDEDDHGHIARGGGLRCGYGYGAYRLLSPARSVAVNQF